MPNPEMSEWVDQVLRATEEGAIKWRASNPTTFTWDVPAPKNGRVILQRVERVEAYLIGAGQMGQRKIVHYVLQVFDLQKQPGPAVQINGADDSQANTQLEKLFETASSAVARGNLDFLKSLLPGGTGPGNPR